MIIKDGRFGAYVTDGEFNATLRRGDEIETITAERAAELLAEKRAKGPAPKKRAGEEGRRPKKAAGEETARGQEDRRQEGRGQEGRRAKKRRRPADRIGSRDSVNDLRGLRRESFTLSRRWEDSAMAKGKRDKAQGQAATKSLRRRPQPATARRPPGRRAARRHTPSTRPPGQRFYDLPYSAPAPRLINPISGCTTWWPGPATTPAYEIDVTLLDAPDHRLIRSGRAAGPPGAGRPRRVVPDRAGLAAAAAQGPDRADGARRPARGAGRPAPAAAPPGHRWGRSPR